MAKMLEQLMAIRKHFEHKTGHEPDTIHMSLRSYKSFYRALQGQLLRETNLTAPEVVKYQDEGIVLGMTIKIDDTLPYGHLVPSARLDAGEDG